MLHFISLTANQLINPLEFVRITMKLFFEEELTVIEVISLLIYKLLFYPSKVIIMLYNRVRTTICTSYNK